VEKYCTAGQATDDNMAHAHCIPKATDTHLEYVILIPFPRQQYFHERALMLRLCLYCPPCFVHNPYVISSIFFSNSYIAAGTSSSDNIFPPIHPRHVQRYDRNSDVDWVWRIEEVRLT